LISAFLIFILAALFASFILQPPKPYRWIAFLNFISLACFAILFSYTTGNATSGTDSLKFFVKGPAALEFGFDSLFQADFMYFLSGAIQKILPLNYTAFNLTGALLFSYVGLIMIMRLNPKPSKNTLLIWWLFTLLPGVHFWHASFGKDSLQLLLIGLIFGARGLLPYLVGVFLLFLVRPHIAIIFAMAEIIRILIARRKLFKDTVILAAATAVGFYALSYLVVRLGGGGLSIAELVALFDRYGDDWRSSTLRLNDTSSLFAFPDFFLRPYLNEISSTGHLAAAVDAWLLFVFMTPLLLRSARSKWNTTPWLFTVAVTLTLVFSNPNVGTAARKKQLLPVATMVIVASTRRRQHRDTNLHDRRLRAQRSNGQLLA